MDKDPIEEINEKVAEMHKGMTDAMLGDRAVPTEMEAMAKLFFELYRDTFQEVNVDGERVYLTLLSPYGKQRFQLTQEQVIGMIKDARDDLRKGLGKLVSAIECYDLREE